MIKEISQANYERTMTKGMVDVTETAAPVVDIWLYVELLVQENIVASYLLEHNTYHRRSPDGSCELSRLSAHHVHR